MRISDFGFNSGWIVFSIRIPQSISRPLRGTDLMLYRTDSSQIISYPISHP
jgi:hypothetical protein